MAELGALANLAAVVCAGLKLSTELYTISAALKNAGKDIRSLSSDIALHCDVLKHVQKTLNKAKSCRASTTAIQTAQLALDESEAIFAELEMVVARFQKRKGMAGTDVITHMKWLYQKPAIQYQRESLGAIRGHLQLMLTTLAYGELLAASLGQVAQKQEVALKDDLRRGHSMYLAQYDVAKRLGKIEDLLAARQTILSKDCMNIHQHEKLGITNPHSDHSRTGDSSALLQAPQQVSSVAGTHRQSRPSTVRTPIFPNTELNLNIALHGTSSPRAALGGQKSRRNRIHAQRKHGPMSSKKKKRRSESRTGYFDGSVETCRDVIRTLLREKGLEDQLPSYAMYVVCTGQERCLRMEERPREILKRLQAAGTNTSLSVRKRRPDEDINPPMF